MNLGYEDGLEVYDGIPEEIAEEELTLSEVVDEYGEAEGNHLIKNGVLIDQRDQSINLRESRFAEADREFQQAFEYSKASIAGSLAKAIGKTAVPFAAGYAAVASGGDPFWVGATGTSAYLMKNTINRSVNDFFHELGNKNNSSRASTHYRMNDIEYEDFGLDSVSDSEFRELVEETDLDDDLVELREQPKVDLFIPFPVDEDF